MENEKQEAYTYPASEVDCLTLHPTSNLTREPEELYHSRTGKFLSSHLLAKCRDEGVDKIFEPTTIDDARGYLRFGSMLHQLFFEPDEFHRDHTQNCPKDEEGKSLAEHMCPDFARKAWELMNEKPHWVTLDDYRKLRLMAVSAEKCLLAETSRMGWPERVARKSMHGIQCQARIDWICAEEDLIIDLKSTRALAAFRGQITKYGYLNQLAFYRDLYMETTGRTAPSMSLLAVEKTPPYGAKMHHVASHQLNAASAANAETMEKLYHYLMERKNNGCQKSKTLISGLNTLS